MNWDFVERKIVLKVSVVIEMDNKLWDSINCEVFFWEKEENFYVRSLKDVCVI